MEEFIRCYEEIYPRMYKTAYYYLKNAEEAKRCGTGCGTDLL